MIQRRRRLDSFAVLAGAALLVVLLPGGVGGTQESSGIMLRTAGGATGFEFIFSRPNQVPFDPIFDFLAGVAGGVLDDASGETKGFASVFYPGDIFAQPQGPLKVLGFPVGQYVFPPDHPVAQTWRSLPDLIPSWPLASRGSYPGDPGQDVDMLGDVTQSAPFPLPVSASAAVQQTNVFEGLVIAKARLGRLEIGNPAGGNPFVVPVMAVVNEFLKPFVGDLKPLDRSLVEVHGLESSYEALKGTASAGTASRTTASQIDLIGGLVQLSRVEVFSSQHGDRRAVRPGPRGVEIGGIKVLGIEVTVDEGGVRVVDERIPAGAVGTVQALLNDTLRGFDMRFSAPSSSTVGSQVSAQAFTVTWSPYNPPLSPVVGEGRTTFTVRLGAVGSEMATGPAPLVGVEMGAPISLFGPVGVLSGPSIVPGAEPPGGAPPVAVPPGDEGQEMSAAALPAASIGGGATVVAGRRFENVAAVAARLRGLTRRMVLLGGIAFTVGLLAWRRRRGLLA